MSELQNSKKTVRSDYEFESKFVVISDLKSYLSPVLELLHCFPSDIVFWRESGGESKPSFESYNT